MSPTKNDITGDFLITGAASDAYRDGWERIFGNKKTAVQAEAAAIVVVANQALAEECLADTEEAAQVIEDAEANRLAKIAIEQEEADRMEALSSAVEDVVALKHKRPRKNPNSVLLPSRVLKDENV
jgi:hypothetical protein